MKKLLEIACFDLVSARTALEAGAHRIEFCSALQEGGLTPGLEDTRGLLQQTAVPVFVMIRPRGGNFVYDQQEFAQMKKSMLAFKTAGVHGFVFGCLTASGEIHAGMNRALLDLADDLPCTFHRAIDHTPDTMSAALALEKMGFRRVLTSGGKGNAPDNTRTLEKLVSACRQMVVMPGGGVRSTNIHLLLQTGAVEFHSSGITASSGNGADAAEIKQLLDALQ